jgi:beta-glucosidase
MFGTVLSYSVTKNVIAYVKHFALNSIENMRFKVNVTYNKKTLNKCYLP